MPRKAGTGKATAKGLTRPAPGHNSIVSAPGCAAGQRSRTPPPPPPLDSPHLSGGPRTGGPGQPESERADPVTAHLPTSRAGGESAAVSLHTLASVPLHLPPTEAATTTTTATWPPAVPAAATAAEAGSSVTVFLNAHPREPTPFYTTAATYDRFQTASPTAVLAPPAAADSDDAASHDVEFLSGPGFLPFVSATSSRSRNSSGASSIEPSITIDPALLPFDLMQMFAQQGLTLAVTEVVPPSGNEDGP